MTAAPEGTDRISRNFTDDESRWQAIVSRDPAADRAFVYSVRTTGVYCRPACASRLALRKNVRFHATCQEAEKAGFRPVSGASLPERASPNGTPPPSPGLVGPSKKPTTCRALMTWQAQSA